MKIYISFGDELINSQVTKGASVARQSDDPLYLHSVDDAVFSDLNYISEFSD